MKKISSLAPLCKMFFILSCIVSVGFNRCEGQSIVGKWKMVSTTTYFTADGAAKQGGKTSIVNPVPASASIISEFKSDHTYLTTTSSSTSPTPSTMGGTWTVSNDKLTITVDPKYHPQKGVELSTVIISITGNTLMITKHIEENNIVAKMVTNAERI